LTSPTKTPSSLFPAITICLSIIELVFMYILLLQPAIYQDNFLLDKNIIGLLFSALCISGIFAAFYPNKCEKTFMFREKRKLNEKNEYTIFRTRFSGHHPDCKKFSKNRIQIGRTTLCSACTGLVVGSVFALLGTILYFFVGLTVSTADIRLLLIGDLGILLGLFQFKFEGYLKLVANALFVVSSFAVLVLADVIGKSFIVDLYVIGVIFFILFARIIISQWNNKKICSVCENCEFSSKF
jgi:hypothetical protein